METTNRLNIVFVSRGSFPDGRAMSKRWRYCIDYFVDNDLADVAFIGTWKNEGFDNPTSGIYRGKVEFKNTSLDKNLKSVLPSARALKAFLKDRYKGGQKNIVIFSTLLDFEHIPAFYYAKKLGYKVVSDQVENYDVEGGDPSRYILLKNRIFPLFRNGFDGFLCISSMLVEKFKKKTKAKLLLLPNSNPIGVIAPNEEFSKPFTVLYTGTMASKDGLVYLVKGFLDFLDKTNANAKLLLVGKGSLPEEIRADVESSEKIECLGFVSEGELQKILETSDVMTMTRCNSPFANYGFPFKLSEYLSTGHPIIATNVGDVEKYVEDKRSAFIVRPENAGDICNALEFIFTHEEEALTVGRNGLDVAHRFFSKDVVGKRLYDFLNEL